MLLFFSKNYPRKIAALANSTHIKKCICYRIPILTEAMNTSSSVTNDHSTLVMENSRPMIDSNKHCSNTICIRKIWPLGVKNSGTLIDFKSSNNTSQAIFYSNNELRFQGSTGVRRMARPSTHCYQNSRYSL